jgi:hypothetical protein
VLKLNAKRTALIPLSKFPELELADLLKLFPELFGVVLPELVGEAFEGTAKFPTVFATSGIGVLLTVLLRGLAN